MTDTSTVCLLRRYRSRNASSSCRRFLALREHAPIYFPSLRKGFFPLWNSSRATSLSNARKSSIRFRALGIDAFPREFRWTETPATIIEKYSSAQAPELEAEKREVRVAGRIVSYRLMGKAGFAHLQGSGKRVQVYARKDVLGEKGFELFHLLDLGDSIGVRGHLFRTKTGELSSLGRRNNVFGEERCCRCRKSGMALTDWSAISAALCRSDSK